MISSVLSTAREVCDSFLAIIEYEDPSEDLVLINTIATKLTALQGVTVQEILETDNFSKRATLYQIVSEYTSDC